MTKGIRIPTDIPSKLYPVLIRGNRGYMFRLGVVLKEDVDAAALRQAVEDLAPRFPVMYSHLIKGFFDYYHVPAHDFDVVIRQDNPERVLPAVFDTDKPSFRLYYFGKKLYLDISHTQADGMGGMMFFRALLTRYFTLRGFAPSPCPGVSDYRDTPSQEETEDANRTLLRRGKRLSRRDSNACRLMTDTVPGLLRDICVTASIWEIKRFTAPRGLTVNDYLLALIYAAILPLYDKTTETLPIKLSVPIDLRGVFKIPSQRNFALYINLEMWPSRDMTFEEVCGEVKKQMRAGTEKERLIKLASSNARLAMNPIVKITPRALRDKIIRKGFRVLGAAKITTTLSNLGYHRLPAEIEGEIERLEVYLGAGGGGFNFSAIGFGDTMSLCICLSGEDNGILDRITALLTEHGVVPSLRETRIYRP